VFKRILVPLDGSDNAEAVLPYAELLAGRTGAQVLLLRVVLPPEEAAATGEAFTYLEGKAEQLRSRSLSCEFVVTGGEAGDTVLAEADSRDADLIAMSTHGRSGLARWVLGSVADKVVHRTVKPLLLVRAHDAEKPPVTIERVLVPLDGSPLSLSVLGYVEDVAAALGAGIVLYNGVPPLDVYPGVETTAARVGNVIDDLLEQGKVFLGQVAAEVKARGKVGEVRSVVTIGFPVDEIVRVAEEVGAGLIAMATHGRSGVDRWVMGSIADGVVRRSSLPCLLVRPAEVARKER
jgi:nucleotide-binding universal stress UspA family protein